MSEKALLFIHALTSLHPGSGTALGTVDLPVQRERHTNWPIIPGSTLKGILRDACREKIIINRKLQDDGPEKEENKRLTKRRKADVDAELTTVFGPPTLDSSAHAGALSITDARILAFPVRSLRGVFAWVTCPGVLQRLSRDLVLAGLDSLPEWPEPDKEKLFCINDSPLLVDGDKVVLEEFEFTKSNKEDNDLADWFAQRSVKDQNTKERIKTHLAVLNDDDFTHFVRHATEIVARIGLNYETKTVRSGALFYEEFLPPETLFYSVVLAGEGRNNSHNKSAEEVLKFLSDNRIDYLQIGGDETIGKGYCAVRLYSEEKS
ncbi:MAG: type III-B CRISPR module RAMP protein Cmr4 [Thermodesulfobacteriota bacterium]